MNGHNEDSIERGSKIRRLTDREVSMPVKNVEATLRTLQEAHAVIGLLGKQRDEARDRAFAASEAHVVTMQKLQAAEATLERYMAATSEAMRWLNPDGHVSVNRAFAALLKATSA